MTASSKYEVNSGNNCGNTSLASTSGGASVSSGTGISQCTQPSPTTATIELHTMGAQMMLQQPNSPSSSSSTSKNNGDATFEPTVEMMVNDFDDEQTLEEEEALAAQEAEDPSAELSNLQKESDMPIEELLALYNCSGSNIYPAATGTINWKKNSNDVGVNENNYRPNSKHNPNPILEPKLTSTKKIEPSSKKEDTPKNLNLSDELEADDMDEDDDDDIKETSQLRELYPETYGSNNKRLLRTISRQQSDEEEDDEYSPDEDEFKKTIMVGSEFQAVIPEGFLKYGDVLPYENEDKLLWDPSRISDEATEEYLLNALKAKQQNGSSFLHANVDVIPVGSHLRDDEQALYLLLQCGHNTDEALRRKRLNAVPLSEQMSSWSEDECRNFESGIRIYGKDFHTIQHTKVRTRSVGELVQFYYLWKKTERHDIFANKARLEKKKYNLHPGLTDYMDRFLEEQEGGSNGSLVTTTTNTSATANNNTPSERSISPATQASHINVAVTNASSMMCLIQTDNKRTIICPNKHNPSSLISGVQTNTTESTYKESSLKDPLAIDDEQDTSKDTIRAKHESLNTVSLPSSVKTTASDLTTQRTVNQ